MFLIEKENVLTVWLVTRPKLKYKYILNIKGVYTICVSIYLQRLTQTHNTISILPHHSHTKPTQKKTLFIQTFMPSYNLKSDIIWTYIKLFL